MSDEKSSSEVDKKTEAGGNGGLPPMMIDIWLNGRERDISATARFIWKDFL